MGYMKCPKGCKEVEYNEGLREDMDIYYAMQEQPFHPNYHLKNPEGYLIPWNEPNIGLNYDDGISPPKMYVCPKCGYTEFYNSLRPTITEEEE